MDTLSLTAPHKGPRPPNETLVQGAGVSWPAAPAAHGKYYGITDKYGASLIVMTKATWEGLGTLIEQQRRTMAGQDTAIKAQSTHIQELTADRDDLLQRLTTLRGNHRELLRERAEKGLVDSDADPLPSVGNNSGFNLFANPKGPRT